MTLITIEIIKVAAMCISASTSAVVSICVLKQHNKNKELQYNILESIGISKTIIWFVTSTPGDNREDWNYHLKELWTRYEKLFILKEKLILQTDGKVNGKELDDLHLFINIISGYHKIIDHKPEESIQVNAVECLDKYKKKLESLYKK